MDIPVELAAGGWRPVCPSRETGMKDDINGVSSVCGWCLEPQDWRRSSPKERGPTYPP